MSQNDFVIANQSAPNFRADLNNALEALASLSSGSTEPSTTYANMLWYDTDNNILKMRTEADDAWIDIGTLNQSTDTFEVAGLTTLSEATWETGTSTTEALVSPAKIAAAIDELVPAVDVGAATAALATQAIGTYIVGFNATTTDYNAGDTLSGSSIRIQIGNLAGMFTILPGGATFPTTNTTTLTGTWKAIVWSSGRRFDGTSYFWYPTLWLRIS